MSRNIFAIVGILLVSTSAIGQDFEVPQSNPPAPANASNFQPPANSGFQPANLPPSTFQEEETPPVQPPQPEIQKTQATIQPVESVDVPEPKAQQEAQPALILPTRKPQPEVQLPAPQPAIQPVELKEDTQVYRSAPTNNAMGVSTYRIEVAREKARARRMRLEAKKWYGIDPARPIVNPRVDLPTYSAFYNGVYSRYGMQYHSGYYRPNFYFHVPVSR